MSERACCIVIDSDRAEVCDKEAVGICDGPTWKDAPICESHRRTLHSIRNFRALAHLTANEAEAFLQVRKLTTSQTILSQAQETISERGEQYGDAKEVFDTTAAMFNAWNAVWSGDGEFGATGVAVFNICQKLARIAHGESDIDNWRDIIGYAALGAEVDE